MSEALVEAAAKNQVVEVKLLLERGANPNAEFRSVLALEIASMRGHFDVAKLLLDAGANPTLTNTFGVSALSLAKKNGHSEIVRLMEEWIAKRKK